MRFFLWACNVTQMSYMRRFTIRLTNERTSFGFCGTQMTRKCYANEMNKKEGIRKCYANDANHGCDTQMRRSLIRKSYANDTQMWLKWPNDTQMRRFTIRLKHEPNMIRKWDELFLYRVRNARKISKARAITRCVSLFLSSHFVSLRVMRKAFDSKDLANIRLKHVSALKRKNLESTENKQLRARIDWRNTCTRTIHTSQRRLEG